VAELLRVRLGHDSPRARYALYVLASLLGCDWTPAGEHADVELPTTPDSDWDEPEVHVAAGDPPVLVRPGKAPDLLYATYACLTGPWEKVDPANKVGTPIAAQGFLARHKLLETPLVHLYAAELARRAGRGLPERRPTIVLTHDVDEHFRHLFGVREALTRMRRDARALSPGTVRRLGGLARRVAERGRPDPNDTWDKWRETLAEWRGRATFFVASYNLFDSGAERYDVAYDVRHPEVAATLRALAEQGAEIGIHFSLQANRSAEQIAREHTRLEEALGLPIRSARHHWWALGKEPLRTLRAQAATGIQVDCSFGFSDLPGFRRGIAAPFRPFDVEEERALPMWSVPTVAMDRAVFDGSAAPDAVLRRLFETTSACGGALVLDWHSHVLNVEVFDGAGEGLRDFVAWALEQGAELQIPRGLVDHYDHRP
jgi:hypothetical protein